MKVSLGKGQSACKDACNDVTPEDHIRLIYLAAHRVVRELGGVVDLSDLVSEGSFGLLRACKTYDANLGAFSTWAMRLIRQDMLQAIPSNRLLCYGGPKGAISIDGAESAVVATMRDESAEAAADVPLGAGIDLKAAVRSLDHRTKMILYALYFEDKTQAMVGQEIGLTGSRIGQIEKRALRPLRRRLVRPTACA